MELASADDTAAKASVLSYFRKEEMPVIHVQHSHQEGATFFYPIQKVLKSIKV
jgi:nicotinamidase-related amidase